MRVVFRYAYAAQAQKIVDFALATLRSLSPVGKTEEGDEHPGLYRDSHMVFLNGRVVADVKDWKRGDQINIANPVPYARKIELGQMKMSVPPNVYDKAHQKTAIEFADSFVVKFVYMPVRFGDIASFAAFSQLLKPGRRRMSQKARRDWLVRQPALEIRAL